MKGALPIILLTCLFAVQAPAADESQEAAQQLQSTVEALNALDKWFSETEKKRADWLVELQRQDRDISNINQDVTRIREQLQQTGADLDELRDRQAELTAQRARQAERIGEHVAAAYRLTGQDFLKQLLNQESPDTFDRMIRYHRHFSESRLASLAEYQDTLLEIEATNAALEERRAEEEQQQNQLLAEQQTLATERRNRSRLIDQLDSETETKQQEYQRLQSDRARIEQLLTELRRRATELDGSSFAAAKGSLPMPTRGSVRHAFGAQRANGRLSWHGIDIRAAQGTPVTAVFRGRVIFADWLRGFGLLTILDHGSDYMTLYGNADVLHKKVGDWVESGEVIAAAGNSGGQRDTGVYFEVRHKGQPKDPISWISRP